jgi:hypothetical protein
VNFTRRRVHATFSPSIDAVRYRQSMEPSGDKPLPATLAFVIVLGSAILVGWILMFMLLKDRW